MTIRLSHSSLSKYQTCAKSYQHRYINHIVSEFKGAPLFFGSAMDLALNHLLLNKDSELALEESMKVFDREWEQQKDNEGKVTDLPLNPSILYSKYDYDPDLFEKSDWRELLQFEDKAFDVRSAVETYLKEGEPWSNIPERDRIVYNFSSWLSLKRKAKLLIQAYHDQILPKIKKVIEIQTEISIKDDDGNQITGFIDLIAEMEDGKVVILDNKTSSMEYEADSVVKSPQLALYLNALRCEGRKIDACGYLVLSKKINKQKTKTCQSCGHVADDGARHKKCNQDIPADDAGKFIRCNGDFDVIKKFTVDTQIIIDEIPQTMLELVMENADSIRQAIETNNFPRNLTVCGNIFGKPCEYYGLCHNGDMHGLLKKERK